MLLQYNQRLDDLLVTSLANEPGMSAEQLREKLLGMGHPFTLQAIYKELSRLVQVHVVTKYGLKYSLRLSWVINLANFGQETLARHSAEIDPSILPDGKNQMFIKWTFSSLEAVDNFLGHLIVLICSTSSYSAVYIWSKHPWHPLINKHNRAYLLNALASLKKRFITILGVKSGLSELVKARFPSFYEVVYLPEGVRTGFSNRETSLMFAAPPYLVSVDFTQQVANRIEDIFLRTKSDPAMFPGQLGLAFQLKSPCVVTITVDPRLLEDFMSGYRPYFADSVQEDGVR